MMMCFHSYNMYPYDMNLVAWLAPSHKTPSFFNFQFKVYIYSLNRKFICVICMLLTMHYKSKLINIEIKTLFFLFNYFL